MEHEVVVPTVYPEHITSKSFIIHLLKSQRVKFWNIISTQKRSFLMKIVVLESLGIGQKMIVKPFVFKTDYFYKFLLWKLGISKNRSLKAPDFSLKQEKRVFAGIYHDRLCVYTSFTRNIYGVWYNLLYTSP